MCTAFVKKGSDIIYGYNLDIDVEQFDYRLYKTENYFTVGIKIGSTVYFTHGVTSKGNFGNLPYMNGEKLTAPNGKPTERIDLIINKLIRGKYTFSDVEKVINTKTIASPPLATMHSLICSKDGKIIIVEPNYNNKIVEKDYAVLTNFPVLTKLDDYSNSFYGKDRYDTAEIILSKAENFTAKDGLNLLSKVKQTGKWGTRVSFVYSGNENKVYYCLDADFDKVYTHDFDEYY